MYIKDSWNLVIKRAMGLNRNLPPNVKVANMTYEEILNVSVNVNKPKP